MCLGSEVQALQDKSESRLPDAKTRVSPEECCAVSHCLLTERCHDMTMKRLWAVGEEFITWQYQRTSALNKPVKVSLLFKRNQTWR